MHDNRELPPDAATPRHATHISEEQADTQGKGEASLVVPVSRVPQGGTNMDRTCMSAPQQPAPRWRDYYTAPGTPSSAAATDRQESEPDSGRALVQGAQHAASESAGPQSSLEATAAALQALEVKGSAAAAQGAPAYRAPPTATWREFERVPISVPHAAPRVDWRVFHHELPPGPAPGVLPPAPPPVDWRQYHDGSRWTPSPGPNVTASAAGGQAGWRAYHPP